jgi:3',5'-cyclic-AMP phosphodiesterase
MTSNSNGKQITTGLELDDSSVLSWLHFGDLHITQADQQNYRDFLALIEDANNHLGDGVNFAVLPGDNADDGIEDQYRLVQAAVDRLAIPLHVIPGDHDIKTGSLDLFRSYLEPEPVQSFAAGSYQCIFLNSVAVGRGVRFGLGRYQLTWLRLELEAATRQDRRCVLFMHTYPSELSDSAAEATRLMRQHRVLMVDMGHTHYNEIANDGHTIYATTRSTGQIEEGPVGFSLANLDGNVVSWKFKPLGDWPFVMITAPADAAFITDAQRANQLLRGTIDVHAKAWGGFGISSARCRVDDEPWRGMSRVGTTRLWRYAWGSMGVTDGVHRITVQVRAADGNEASDTISVLTSQAGRYQPPQRQPGDDANAIGAYPEKGILGTQLGPNKNGRKW